jgi:molybdopterin-guanine dinucleotide biosynthesis protein A
LSVDAAIPIVILAGGEGQRMGGHKPLRILGEQRLIDHAMAMARRWSAVRAVAVRQGTRLPISDDIEILIDRESNGGPLSGIASALAFTMAQNAVHVLIFPCDMPFLPDDLLARLWEGIGDAAIAMPRCGGQMVPVCGLWRAEALNDLPRYLATGRRSPIGFAQMLGAVLVDWPDSAAADFANINDAADLAMAAARLIQKSRTSTS